MIIDFHTHIFPDKIAASTIKKLAGASHSMPFTYGSAAELSASMNLAGISYSVNLPVMTSAEQVEKVNFSMVRDRERYLEQGIIVFGGMHPDYSNYREEIRWLSRNNIPGIKLHPAYQGVCIDDIRMMRIIECACEEGMIVLTHAGYDIGIMDRNYCSVPQILKVIEEVHPQKFVLAHMGNWSNWEEVEKYLCGAPLMFDTAFSIGPITPDPDSGQPPVRDSNLFDDDFVRIARKHGTDHILFGTDSPWADQADYVRRIENMDFTQSEKNQIFSENAIKLLTDTTFSCQ